MKGSYHPKVLKMKMPFDAHEIKHYGKRLFLCTDCVNAYPFFNLAAIRKLTITIT